ncbi:hypothetical protein TCAL_00122 [Tigriopus californicus]|uniref:Uncharacterized protein n=1 Tax=Tigriopus californicus TaxID=6832 RepID=A0A553PHU7_TIGCA|nr:hypothetical protein TCAL_00122 [Tigriopus californicus]
MTSTCQENGEWTQVEQCLISHCIGSPPSQIGSNFEIYYENNIFTLGQDPPVGAHLEYRCPSQHFFESNQSLTSFEVLCGSDGQFVDPVDWPVCIDLVNCQKSDLPTTKFVFEPEHDSEYSPGDIVRMECPSPSLELAEVSNSSIYDSFQVECLANGSWNVTNFDNLTCLRIGCDLPSTPSGFMRPVIFGVTISPTFVRFGQSVSFRCQPHQRFEDDYDNSRFDAICRNDGVNGTVEMPSPLPRCVDYTRCLINGWDPLVQLRKVKEIARKADKSQWTAKGSSVYQNRFPLSNAFDSDFDSLYHSRDGLFYGWLELDLHTTLKVYMISIAKRFLACCERYEGIETRVGPNQISLPADEQSSQPISINQVCTRIDDYSDEGYLVDFKCDTPIEGRYVTVQRMGKEYLQLNNIEIYHIIEHGNDEETEIVAPLARDCQALYLLGFKIPGIYRIDPTGSQSSDSAVQVHCQNGWTLVLKRDFQGSAQIDFGTKNLADLEAPLGDPTDDFWIGLQALHKLTTSNHYELEVIMTGQQGESGLAQYGHLTIDNGPEYTIKVENFSTSSRLAVEDDLSWASESNFLISGRCFEESGAPGWYKSTHCSTPNGECQFPWVYSRNGLTYLECDFAYDSTAWCGTQLNAEGVYISGSGQWARCHTSCPGAVAGDYELINPGGFSVNGFPQSFETFQLECPKGQVLMINGDPRDDYETTCNWNKSWTEDVTVKCEYGLQPPDEPEYTLELKVVIQVQCDANNSFVEPTTWPICVSSKQCPSREGPPSSPINGSAILSNRGTTFGPCIDQFSDTFQCKGEVGIRTESRSMDCPAGLCSKYSIILNPSQPIQNQYVRIQFSSDVNLVGIDTGHEASQVNHKEIFISGTNLNAFPGSTTSFSFEVSHEATPQRTLPCVYDIQCSNTIESWWEIPSTSNGTLDPTSQTFEYGSTITYKCAPGLQFVDENENPIFAEQNFTCGFDEAWFPSSPLKRCESVFCDPPPPSIVDGSIDMLKSGLSFGTSCLGSQEREPIPSTDCPDLQSQVVEKSDNSTTIRLLVKPTESIHLAMLMMFSQPFANAQVDSSRVTVLPSGMETVILASMELLGSYSQLNVRITHDPLNEPCLLQAMCASCLSNEDCLDQGGGLVKNLDLSVNLTQYGTTLAYSCPPGQRFVDNSSSQILSCGWNRQWEPSNQLLGCEAVACVNPPLAPNGTRLLNNYTINDEVAFNDHVPYYCQDGYFFEQDYNLEFFNLTCHPGGNWSEPVVWPKCLHPREKFCHDPPAPPTNGGIYDWNEKLFANGTSPFSLEVSYSCDIARKLANQSQLESGQDPLYDEAVLKCAWNGKWSPSERLDPCVWTKCINPPTPSGHNLKHTWHGQPLEFYENVTYKCVYDGYWFEGDRNLVAFDVPCLPGGEFGVPAQWPVCLRSIDYRNVWAVHVELLMPIPVRFLAVECGNPPPKPRGGIMKWDGLKREYGTTIEYECGPNAMFQEVLDDGSSDNFYKSKSITCSWNRTWTPERLDRCIWTKCSAIPEPDPSTGLQFIPNDVTKNLQILTNYSKYSPEIPMTLAVSLDFRGGSSLLFDGYLHDSIQENPRLILTNEAGTKFLDITIDPLYSVMKLTSDLRPNFEREETLLIDVGDPFRLEIDYRPGKFEFQFIFNDERLPSFKVPDSIPDLDIHSLVLTGDVIMNFVGRKVKGLDPMVDVGTKVEFACPSGTVFAHNWYTRPSFKMTCLNTGTFDAPEIFPTCVERED